MERLACNLIDCLGLREALGEFAETAEHYVIPPLCRSAYFDRPILLNGNRIAGLHRLEELVVE